jgi:gas vesicle protein
MNRLVGVLVSVAVGAAAAYMLDPDRGRTRRAVARDKAIAMSNRLNGAFEGKSRHWSNIALGYLAEARSLFERSRRRSQDTITRVGKSA